MVGLELDEGSLTKAVVSTIGELDSPMLPDAQPTTLDEAVDSDKSGLIPRSITTLFELAAAAFKKMSAKERREMRRADLIGLLD